MGVKQFDILICGAGASGLLMAYRLLHDSHFATYTIGIIDSEKKLGNDRTWCFWAPKKHEFSHLVKKHWHQAQVNNATHCVKESFDPLTYQLIESADFYSFMWNEIQQSPQVTFIQETVTKIVPSPEGQTVHTQTNYYHTKQVLNSIDLHAPHLHQKNYPVLHQHFIGWFIQTPSPVFDAETAIFMDFNIPQKENTRFMYVLPTSSTHALFEYTLFSENLLSTEEYETGIESYLARLGIRDYTLVRKEYGNIPMTCYPFHQHNTPTLMHIGTAGGWTKASTGFTFMNSVRKSKELTHSLKNGKALNWSRKINRFWVYDLILLSVLQKHNYLGSHIFTTLFKENSVKTLFHFLDEKTTWKKEISILFSVPQIKFISESIRQINNMLRHMFLGK